MGIPALFSCSLGFPVPFTCVVLSAPPTEVFALSTPRQPYTFLFSAKIKEGPYVVRESSVDMVRNLRGELPRGLCLSASRDALALGSHLCISDLLELGGGFLPVYKQFLSCSFLCPVEESC